MRVLVCGGRNYKDRDHVFSTLDTIAKADAESNGIDTKDNWLPHPEFRIIHGAATGADSLAADWAVTNWVTELIFPADWSISLSLTR